MGSPTFFLYIFFKQFGDEDKASTVWTTVKGWTIAGIPRGCCNRSSWGEHGRPRIRWIDEVEAELARWSFTEGWIEEFRDCQRQKLRNKRIYLPILSDEDYLSNLSD